MQRASPFTITKKMTLKKTFLFILILACIMSPSFAQTSKTDPNDVEGWAGIGLNFKLPGKWDLGIDYQLRTDSNVSRYKGSYFTPEVNYKLSKKFKAIVNFRYASTNNGNSSRIGMGMEYAEKFKKWKLDFRPQLQYTVRYANDGDVSNQSKWILRTKIGMEHALSKKLEAYASIEPFFTFDKTEYFIDNIRNTIGLKYEYKKNNTIGFFYIYRPDYAKSYNRNFHIAGIKIDLNWKIK